MSLIADALKTAQRDAQRNGGPTAAEVRATEGFFAYRDRTPEKRSSVTMYAVGGVSALLLVIVALYFQKGAGPEALAAPRGNLPAVPLAPAPAASPSPASLPPDVPLPADDAVGARSAMMQFDAKAGVAPGADFSLERPMGAMSTPLANPDPSFRNPPIASSALQPLESGPPAEGSPLTVSGGPPRLAGAAASPAPSDLAAPPKRVRRPGTLQITVERGAPDRVVSGVAQQALDAQRRGDVTRARELYGRAIAQGAASAELYNNLGVLNRGAGDLTGAAEQFRNAIALDRAYAPAWSNLGIVMDALGHRPEAIAAFQQARTLDPTNVATKLNLALQFRATGASADAHRLLDDVIRAAPEFAEGHYALGQVLEDAGDRAGAVREYQLFLKTAGTRLPSASTLVRQHLAQLATGAR